VVEFVSLVHLLARPIPLAVRGLTAVLARAVPASARD
jgi:hypothetical protein